MSRQFSVLRRAALFAVTAALLLTPISAFAQGGGPLKADQFRNPLAFNLSAPAAQAALQAADVSPQDATFEVIAEGLNNPRGLDLTIKNQLYVAEAGVGGTDPSSCVPNPEDPTAEVCAGNTSSVTRINLNNGAVSRVATGFPSGAGPDGSGAGGLSDVSFSGGGNFGIINLGGDPAIRETFGMGFGREVKNPQSPKWRYTVDVSQHEADANPDGGAIDSNPYSIAGISGTEAVVADAGANALLKTNAATQTVTTLAVFPPRIVPVDPMIQDMFGLPPEMPAEAVPNAVVIGPDGAAYVGLLGGFPFTPGYTSVYRVAMDGSMTMFEDGFTAIIDIAFDAAGNLYVLEIAKNGLLGCEIFGDCTGALIKVDKITGVRTEIASEGLVAPGGVVVAADGSVFVSNFSVMPGIGQVVKITP